MGMCGSKRQQATRRPSGEFNALLDTADPETPVIEVTLLAASNLDPADISGKSDPYVKFKIIDPTGTTDSQRVQSTHKAKTLDPVWEPSERFQFVINNKETQRLLVSVYDFDAITSDDPIGDAVVLLKSLPPGKSHLDLQLVGTSGQRLRGTVTVEIEWMTVRQAQAVKMQEVYEYERWQPVVGWGQTRPGHLLPTDQGAYSDNTVVHWGMGFDEIVKPLENGWEVKDPWHYLARSGDPLGWQYAVNFHASKWYDQQSREHVVRRRLWVRQIIKTNQ